MRSTVDKSERSRHQSIDTLLCKKDCVTRGLGELLDAGSDVDRVADKSEFEFASAADGAGDHHTGVDADTDPQLPAKSLGHKAMDHHRRTYRRIGMIAEVVRGAKHRQRSVAEELV